jgi:hypothetical protein
VFRDQEFSADLNNRGANPVEIPVELQGPY